MNRFIYLLFIAVMMCVNGSYAQTPVAQTTPKARDYFVHPHFNAEDYPARVRTGADKKPIPEQKFEVIETGLEPISTVGSGIGALGYWINDHTLLLDALQDVPNANVKKLQRVVLFDAITKKITTLVPEGRLICWDSELQIASIAPLIYEKRPDLDRLYHLDEQGNFALLKEDRSDVDTSYCRSKKAFAPRGRGLPYSYDLREADGYLFVTDPNGKTNPDQAFLQRPGDPPKKLSIRGSEITRVRYLPYLNKYLLHDFDSEGNSKTDKRLAGVNWKRPYDLTPYNLMSPDGTIEELPYPYIMFEYGISGFGTFLPMKMGTIIQATGATQSEYGMFLIQGDKLSRFYGGPGPFGLDGRVGTSGLVSSPDGCQVAFRRFSDWSYQTKKYITIINLCKAK